MTEIVALETRPNVRLVRGATQYWREQPCGAGFEELYAAAAHGRTLLIGMGTPALLEALNERAADLHILTRGIPDAVATADALPDATVWCGDPRDVQAEPFDVVLCLLDAADVVPLESEDRTWREVMDDVVSLAGVGGTVIALVESDLGIHRLLNSRSPHSDTPDTAWAPLRTWDDSRPRTIDQLREALPGATVVHCVWPSPTAPTLLASVETSPGLHAALATHASGSDVSVADPSWIVSAARSAGRLPEFAPGWLVTMGPATLPTIAVLRSSGEVINVVDSDPTGESALTVFARLAGAGDLPGIRSLVSAWAAATRGAVAEWGLCTATPSTDGWIVEPLSQAATPGDEGQWEALAGLVTIIKGRAWPTPWPSTASTTRILNHLGIMAGLHTLPESRARVLLEGAGQTQDLTAADPQTIAAVVDAQRQEIDTLRSKLNWVTLMYNNERVRPASAVVAVGRLAKSRATRTTKKALSRAKRVLKAFVR